MNKNVAGVMGFVMIIMGIILPFLNLEKSKGDVLPLLSGGIVFLVGLFVLTYALRRESK